MKMKNKQACKRLVGFDCRFFAVLAFAFMVVVFAPARANAQRKVRNKYVRPKRIEVDNKVYNVCELMPCFKGGDAALLRQFGIRKFPKKLVISLLFCNFIVENQ